MNNLVEIVNLTKKYGANVAVNNLTVSLPKGKIIGLLGPNGSGKTTLIKILNGLLTPTEGTIMIDGNYVGPATKSKVAYLPDRTYLTMNQTIREILDFFQDFYADFSRERAVGSSGTPSCTITYSGITTRLSTISPVSFIGLISSSGIFGGYSPKSVCAGITTTFSSSSVTFSGFMRIGCRENSPARISEPDTSTGSKPSAVT